MFENHGATSVDPVHAGNIVGSLKTLMIAHALPLWADRGWMHRTAVSSSAGYRWPCRTSGAATASGCRPVRSLLRQGRAARWYPQGAEIACQ